MATATLVTDPAFSFPEPRDFPSLKLLFYIIQYLQEHYAAGQSPQNTCRQLVNHSSILYEGILKRIKDVDSAPAFDKGTASTFKAHADALESLEDILSALAFAVKSFSTTVLLEYLLQTEKSRLEFNDMEKVMKFWTNARTTLHKGIEDLVNTKSLQSISVTTMEDWEDALKRDDMTSLQEICDDVTVQLRQMGGVDSNGLDAIDDIRDYFRELKSVSLEGTTEAHRIEIIRTVLIIRIPIRAFKADTVSEKWKAHMKNGSIWGKIKKSVRKFVSRVKDAANVPISKFKEDTNNDFEDIADTMSDTPRLKPALAGGNPHLHLLPLFKQLPKVQRPFYSQAKALTYILNDVADTSTSVSSADTITELGRFMGMALVTLQKASTELGDYRAITEDSRMRTATELYKETLDKLQVFVLGNKLPVIIPDTETSQKRDTLALERLKAFAKSEGSSSSDQAFFEVAISEMTVRVV